MKGPDAGAGSGSGLDAQGAFAAYEAVRHRLPPAGPGGACRHAGSLAEIAAGVDVFLLDAYGVLNVGETAIPGVAERIAALRAMGKRVLVVSNAAGVPHEALMAKYARLGYSFPPEDVVTSRATLCAALATERPRRWGMMADPGAGLRERAGLRLSPLADDPAAYADAEGFVLVGSTGWTEARQALLERALAARPRPVLVGNPDIVAPRERGFSTEPGHFAHRLADRTGVTPRFFGKPFADIYARAFARLDPAIPRGRVLMVGDSLHTDILGAQAAGIRSALISGYGFFAGSDAAGAIGRAGIRPDFIVTRP